MCPRPDIMRKRYYNSRLFIAFPNYTVILLKIGFLKGNAKNNLYFYSPYLYEKTKIKEKRKGKNYFQYLLICIDPTFL